MLAQLERLRHGQLTILEDGEERVYGDAQAELRARIEVQDPAVWPLVAANGSIGSGEAYIHGYWTTPDLTAVIRVFVANLDVLDGMERGLASLGRPLVQGLHWLNRNTRAGSRRNIAAHYDLGNDLFEQMLDPTMMYSAAQFASPDQGLEQAQLNKLARICRKLELKPDDHLLEIGTGWGSMALYAATHHGCRVTTTTLSREQYEYTCRRIEEQGLQSRVTVLLQDYRDLDGRFDKLVSIEMVEAVGHRFLPTYFSQCARLLKDDGLMLLQAITMRDQRYEQARRSVDFIQRYIFPAAPCLGAEDAGGDHPRQRHEPAAHGGLRPALRAHPAPLARQPARGAGRLEQLGYDETFYRLWEFYLCYCEGGFLERAIGTAQLLLAKPGARPSPLLGQLDA